MEKAAFLKTASAIIIYKIVQIFLTILLKPHTFNLKPPHYILIASDKLNTLCFPLSLALFAVFEFIFAKPYP